MVAEAMQTLTQSGERVKDDQLDAVNLANKALQLFSKAAKMATGTY